MTTFRDIKRNARRDRHTQMAVPALYYTSRSDPLPTPVDCTVRVWLKNDEMSGAAAFPGSAEMATPEDRLRFDLADFSAGELRRGGTVSVESGEAYIIDHLYAIDDGWQTARVTRLTAAEIDAAELAVPE